MLRGPHEILLWAACDVRHPWYKPTTTKREWFTVKEKEQLR